MCVLSTVYDQFKPKFDPWDNWLRPGGCFPTGLENNRFPDLDRLEKLIERFEKAVALAKELDRLMDAPDCEDPSKAKLEELVKGLKEVIDKVL